MPRNVRSAWLDVSVEGARGGSRGMGPKAHADTLTAQLTLRTPEGGVSDPIVIDAGWEKAHAVITFPAGMDVETETDSHGRMVLTVRPGWGRTREGEGN